MTFITGKRIQRICAVKSRQGKQFMTEYLWCAKWVSRPYRAPELMYSPKKYDPVGSDLWSMGVTMAIFYAPIHLELDEDESSDSQSSSASSKEQPSTSSVRSTPGYIIPVGLSSIPLHTKWRRDALFDATRGEIAMLWSIFQLMGTPTQDSWPVRTAISV